MDPQADWLKEVTFCIKTFERPKAVQHTIKSIRNFFPDAYIIVADDSRRPQEPEGCSEYIKLPFDVGLSRGRNFMVDAVKTKYMLLLDDDTDFYSRTNIKLMYDTIENTDFNVVGGFMGWGSWHGVAEIKDGVHYLINRCWRGMEDGYKVYDHLENFFIAETEVIKKVRWADELKIGAEHEEMFLRGKGVLKCTSVNSRVGNNKTHTSRFYGTYRKRSFKSHAHKHYYNGLPRKILFKEAPLEEIYDKLDKVETERKVIQGGKPKKLPKPSADENYFVVNSHIRSGCHLLRGLLNSHSKINMGDELTHPRYNDAERAKLWTEYNGYIHHYTNASFSDLHRQALKWPKQVKHILLRRENFLNTFVSMKRAQIINSWHNPPLMEGDVKEDPEGFCMTLDPDDYRWYKRRFYEYYDLAKEFLEKRDREIIEVRYEKLLEDMEGETKRILDFLGYDYEPLTIQTGKQITKSYPEIVTNWDEMLEVDKMPEIKRPYDT